MSDNDNDLDSMCVTGTTNGSPPVTWIDDIHTVGVISDSIANQEQTKLHWEEVLSSPDVRLFPRRPERRAVNTQYVNTTEFKSTVDSDPISIENTKSLWEKTFTEAMERNNWEAQHNTRNTSYVESTDNYKHVDSNDNFYEINMQQDIYLQPQNDSLFEFEVGTMNEGPPPPLPDAPPPSISQAMFNEMTEADRGSELLKKKNIPVSEQYIVGQQKHPGSSEQSKECDQKESIVEREIREQQLREREIEKEHKSVYEMEKESTHMNIVEPTQEKFAEPEIPAASDTPTAFVTRSVPPLSVSSHALEPPVQETSPITVVSVSPDVSPPVVVVSKPIMTAVHKTDQHNQIRVHSGGAYSHAGESFIAREIREQKERENELRQHWKSIGLESPYKEPAVSETPFSLPEPVQVIKNVHSEAQKETELTPTSVRHSQRSVNGDEYDEDVFDGKEPRLESRAPMVKPLLDALSELEHVKPYKYEPTNETAVEREVRLAKEREDELRRMKGLPVSTPVQQKGDLIVEFGGTDEAPVSNQQQRPQLKYKKGHEGDDKGNLKRFFASKIQQELEREKEREQDLKSTGRIKTVSEEYKAKKKKVPTATLR